MKTILLILTLCQSPKYKQGDTVQVKNRYEPSGYVTYVIVGRTPNVKQIMYDCRNLQGREFTRLPERSIKNKKP